MAKPKVAPSRPQKTKQIRVKLSYIAIVQDDLDVHRIGANIHMLAARGLLAFTRDDDETVQIKGGTLSLSAVGRKAFL